MKPHLFLNNPRGEQKVFKVQRKLEEEDESEPVEEKPSLAYKNQKAILRRNLVDLLAERTERQMARNLIVPEHIEYVSICFFSVFNNAAPFYTAKKFENDFGLTAVSLLNFNQTILFAVTGQSKFLSFLDLVQQFTESKDTIHPNGQPYHIITIIANIEFLSSRRIATNINIDQAILALVTPADQIADRFSAILTALIIYLDGNGGRENKINYKTDYQTSIEIQEVAATQLNNIINNFDIIHSVQSIRSPTIQPNNFGQPELTWNHTINPPANRTIIIGVLDNGVRKIRPLENIIVDRKIDITNKLKPEPLLATHPRGTSVATLAAIGTAFFDKSRKVFDADAMIMPIKILNFNTGNFNIYEITDAIQKAIRAGVRIFNLSVCGPSKEYNKHNSEYAYLLDKLTYENDILIFIATGNLDLLDIQAMQQANPPNDFHNYPNHFYNPYESSNEHVCEATNICIPSESMNNITVGALAENYDDASVCDLTPFKELPAYYTKKWHLDYTKKINGVRFAPKQTNNNIIKPDIVMPGGDLSVSTGQMQAVGFGENGNDFYTQNAGTSLAAPIAANLAAKILKEYPDFTMQSVKALIINAAERPLNASFLTLLVDKVKNEIALEIFKKKYDRLDQSQKTTISSKLSDEKLYKKLVGHGLPIESRALYSDNKSVTLVIQDSVMVGTHKVIKLNIPKYLLKYSRNGPLLRIKATLCYKFKPVANNQLAHNPLHISMNIFSSIAKDNPVRTAEIISDKSQSWYNKFTVGLTDEKSIMKAKNCALAIKANIQSWSEDFFPLSSKPFANTQQFEININKNEIAKVGNEVSVAIRCTYKRELLPTIEEELKKTSHSFSIVMQVAEQRNTELKDYDLYEQLKAVNDLDIYPEQDIELEDDDLEV